MSDQTRQQWIDKAIDASRNAAVMASHAESAAHSTDRLHTVAGFATTGALYADLARTHTTIAALLPDDTSTETPDD